MPYSPLARGVLTAKYARDVPPDIESRAGRRDPRMLETEWRPESLDIAIKLRDHAAARGLTPVQLAVAWVLNSQAVSSVVAGPRTLEQWAAYASCADVRLGAEDEALFDRLVVPGHPSTPGFNDPAYPLEDLRGGPLSPA